MFNYLKKKRIKVQAEQTKNEQTINDMDYLIRHYRQCQAPSEEKDAILRRFRKNASMDQLLLIMDAQLDGISKLASKTVSGCG